MYDRQELIAYLKKWANEYNEMPPKVEAYRILAEEYGIPKYHVGKIIRNEIWTDNTNVEVNNIHNNHDSQKSLEDYL